MLKQRRLAPKEYTAFKSYIESCKEEFEPEDWLIIEKWLSLKPASWFRGKSVDEIDGWLEENVANDLKALEMAQANIRIASSLSGGVPPSEAEIEDAYQWVDSTDFTGSPKQIKWAKSIAHRHHDAIARAWKKGVKIPSQASWWINNRDNIVVNIHSN